MSIWVTSPPKPTPLEVNLLCCLLPMVKHSGGAAGTAPDSRRHGSQECMLLPWWSCPPVGADGPVASGVRGVPWEHGYAEHCTDPFCRDPRDPLS